MSLYLFVSIRNENEAGLAAALKYFLLSALSTTFLLKGVAIIYLNTGSTNYEEILIKKNKENNYKIELGQKLILMTLLFKLSAAPFYQWAPDLYENINTNYTMYMMIIPKITVIFFILNLNILDSLNTQFILLITGTLSLLIGAIALNNQWFIKRFFSFSGISHIGFILLSFYCLDTQSAILYTFIYALTTINLFSIFLILGEIKGKEIKIIKDLKGIFKYNPFLSFCLAINLFSLAGKGRVYLL